MGFVHKIQNSAAPWRRCCFQGLVQENWAVVGYGGKRENPLNHSNIFVVLIITITTIFITISLKICTGTEAVLG